jgi:hypothetical protein
MIAKKFAVGFGIAVLLPMTVHYGVSTFSPGPEWEEYQVENYYERHERATPEEQVELEEENSRIEKKYREELKLFQKHMFAVAVPIGIVALVLGAMLAVQAIGSGLMFGGIFTLTNGYWCYWSELQDWMRFLSLLAALAILIFIGYRKLGRQGRMESGERA